MLHLDFNPFPELKTDRLLLRKMNMSDAPEMFFLRSNKSVLKYIGKEPAKTVQEAEALIEKINSGIASAQSIMWAITLKENPGKMIGTICYWNMQPEHFRSEIGFLLHPDHWRKGIMKEAIKEVLVYGFDHIKLHSVEGRIHPDNIASASAMQSNGFVKEGYLKEDFYFNGEFLDTVIYSRLA